MKIDPASNTSNSSNPYAPHASSNVVPESIAFEGIVTEEMYRSLFSRRETYLLWTFSCSFSGIVLWILAAEFVATWPSKLKAPLIFGMLGLIFGILIAAVYIMGRLTIKARVQLYLQKYPNLLGPAKGTFTSNGLLIDDQENIHWLSWTRLSPKDIGKNGVRVTFEDVDPLRFAALGAELFCDGYRPRELAQMLSRCKNSKSTYEDLSKESAQAFEMQVEDPCFFYGYYATPEKWTTWLQLLIRPLGLVFLCMLCILRNQWSPFLIILIALLSYSAIACISSMIRLVRQRNLNHHTCWGWLTENHLTYGTGLHAIRTPISALICSESNQETLQFQYASGESFFVFRQHFKDSEYFNSIRSKLLTQTSSKRV